MSATRVDRVVVGISGSLGNLSALHAAVAQAQRADAQLVAVLAWTPVGGEIAYRRAPCPPLLTHWWEQARSTLVTAFTDAFGGPPPEVPIRSVIVRGLAGPVLVKEASLPGDVLVVGAGRRGRITRRLPGSVSKYCLTHAACPVLAVPQPEMIRELRGSQRAWRKRAALPTADPALRLTDRQA